jgi:hypothetical protein
MPSGTDRPGNAKGGIWLPGPARPQPMHHGMPGTMAPTEHRPPAGAGINDNTTPGNPTGPIWMTQQTYRLPLKLKRFAE